MAFGECESGGSEPIRPRPLRPCPRVGLRAGGGQSPEIESSDRFDAVISTLPITELIGLLSSSEQSERARESASHLKFLENHLFFLKIRRPPEAAGAAQWLYFPQPGVVFNRGYLPANFDASMGAPRSRPDLP